jgi:hypothetical protein
MCRPQCQVHVTTRVQVKHGLDGPNHRFRPVPDLSRCARGRFRRTHPSRRRHGCPGFVGANRTLNLIGSHSDVTIFGPTTFGLIGRG